jgi:hypothetical protein
MHSAEFFGIYFCCMAAKTVGQRATCLPSATAPKSMDAMRYVSEQSGKIVVLYKRLSPADLRLLPGGRNSEIRG